MPPPRSGLSLPIARRRSIVPSTAPGRSRFPSPDVMDGDDDDGYRSDGRYDRDDSLFDDDEHREDGRRLSPDWEPDLEDTTPSLTTSGRLFKEEKQHDRSYGSREN